MGYSLGQKLYFALSRNAGFLARRKLSKRLEQGKEDPARIDERMGKTGVERPDGLLVWFHAASVGESLSLLELIHRLGILRPDLSFLVTTGTKTSADLMTARLPDRAIHQYIPVDYREAVENFITHWHPDLAVWTESEFWPSLMYTTRKRDIPMILVNARMSKKSYDKWRWVPGFATSVVNMFSQVLAQDAATARYLHNLGLEPEKLEVTGTLKEGSSALPHNERNRANIAGQIATRPVWLAASTHVGEEILMSRAHRLALKVNQRLLLILVPRHPERGSEISKQLQDDGWVVMQRSKGEELTPETEIYLADTLGELGLWFRIAPVSFIGGSLVKIGGHNPYEPAALGSAILHGPYVENFADIYYRLAQAGAAIEVTQAEALAEAVTEILIPDKAAQMAHAAWEVCSDGAEVTDRVLEVLLDYLPPELVEE